MSHGLEAIYLRHSQESRYNRGVSKDARRIVPLGGNSPGAAPKPFITRATGILRENDVDLPSGRRKTRWGAN